MANQLAFFFFYSALTFAPMTLITVFCKLDGFFVLIFAHFINREQIIPIEMLGIFICFGTVTVISLNQESTPIEGSEPNSQSDTVISYESNQRVIGFVLAVLHAISMGATIVLTRRLKDVPTLLITFWSGLIGMIGAFAYIAIEGILSEDGLRMAAYTHK